MSGNVYTSCKNGTRFVYLNTENGYLQWTLYPNGTYSADPMTVNGIIQYFPKPQNVTSLYFWTPLT